MEKKVLAWSTSVFICFLMFSIGSASKDNPESRVYRAVFEDYNNQARPVRHPDDEVHLNISFVFRSLGGIEEREETLNVVGYFVLEWVDYQLAWNPEEYNGTKLIKVAAETIWLPDFTISNSINEYHQYTFKRDFGLWVNYEGAIHWAYGGLFSSVCELDLTNYPFDSHNCSLKLESWLHDEKELHVNVMGAGFDTQSLDRDSLWDMQDMIMYYQPVTEGWPAITVSFLWQRKIEYHVFNIICPTVFVLFVALGIFWLPAECGEKISLSVTVLLAFSVIQLVIMDIMPANSEKLPNISLLVVGVMILSTVSVLTSMAVVYMTFKPASTPVPRVLRRLLYSKLSKFAGLSKELPYKSFTELKFDDDSSDNDSNETAEFDLDKSQSFHVYDIISHLTKITASSEKEFIRKATNTEQKMFKLEQMKIHLLEDISKNLKAIVKRNEVQSHEEDIVTEWKVLAKIMDRIIFIICVTVIVIGVCKAFADFFG